MYSTADGMLASFEDGAAATLRQQTPMIKLSCVALGARRNDELRAVSEYPFSDTRVQWQDLADEAMTFQTWARPLHVLQKDARDEQRVEIQRDPEP